MFGRLHARFGVIVKRGLLALLPAVLGPALVLSSPAAAAHRHTVSLTYPSKDAALIIDGRTGKALYTRNADAKRYPASLTKLMTLYLLFQAMQKGQVTLQTPMTVSAHAAGQAPVKLYMRPGETITVDQAIKAIVVRSANDVAVVIAEKLGGTERHFAQMMNAEARKLGMMHTHYVNASGLPNRHQITTADDLAILARHVAYDFPQYFHFFATPRFTFHGQTWDTHDNLIGRYKGADGMKTGYTAMSGFNLVSSVVRGGANLIGIVMGGRTAHMRDKEMIRLLNATFARIQTQPTLVARAQVPWRAIGNGAVANPVIAGFTLNGDAVPKPRARTVVTSIAPQLRSAKAVDPDDEDTAEERPDPTQDEIANIIAPKPAPRVAAPTPSPRPAIKVALADPPKPVAAPTSVPQPTARSIALREMGGVTPSAMNALGLHDWTIQIGAYANPNMAKKQLAAYARRSMDILGQAERIVVPFQGVGGHTLYRARFGGYAEAEARKVCQRLTKRGQTCFAAVAER